MANRSVPLAEVAFDAGCCGAADPPEGALGAVDARGMSFVAWQCGHFPFLPALVSGVRSSLPH